MPELTERPGQVILLSPDPARSLDVRAFLMSLGIEVLLGGARLAGDTRDEVGDETRHVVVDLRDGYAPGRFNEIVARHAAGTGRDSVCCLRAHGRGASGPSRTDAPHHGFAELLRWLDGETGNREIAVA